jgi:hypothetical protein
MHEPLRTAAPDQGAASQQNNQPAGRTPMVPRPAAAPEPTPGSTEAPAQPSGTAPPPGEGPGKRRADVRLKALSVVVAGVLVLIAGFVTVRPLSSDPKPAPPAPDPTVSHLATGPLNGRTEASFTVSSGAEEVTVHSSDLPDELYRVSTPPGSSVSPVVTDTSNGPTLTLTGTKVAGQASVHVYLNKSVLWRIHLAGGGLTQAVDFPSGKLASVDIDAGAQQVDVAVPPPTGTMRIALTGGSGLLAVHLAAGVPVQVADPAGTGTMVIDGKLQTGPLVTQNGWATAPNRYQIQASGPVAKLTVDRHP